MVEETKQSKVFDFEKLMIKQRLESYIDEGRRLINNYELLRKYADEADDIIAWLRKEIVPIIDDKEKKEKIEKKIEELSKKGPNCFSSLSHKIGYHLRKAKEHLSNAEIWYERLNRVL